MVRFGKEHAVADQLIHINDVFVWADYIPSLAGSKLEPKMFERCFNQSKGENLDLVDTDLWPCDHEAYREFYRRDKQTFAKWEKGRESPEWGSKPLGERKHD